MPHRTLIPRLFTLAGIGLVIGAVHSAVHSPPVVLTLKPLAVPAPGATQGAAPSIVPGPQSPGAATPSPEQHASGIDVTLAQALEMHKQGVQFLDARHKEEYEAGHVEGAFWLSAEQFLGGKVPEAMSVLDPKAPVIVYCGGGLCDASKNLVILLQQAGFTQCRIMNDGYPAWQSAGNPTATGPDPLTGGL